MRKTLIEKIKPEVLQAVRDNNFLSEDFDRKRYYWYKQNENLNELYGRSAFNHLYELVSKGVTSHIKQTTKNLFFINAIAYLTSNYSYLKKSSYLKTMQKGNIITRYRKTKKGFVLTDEFGNDVYIDLLSQFKNVKEFFPQVKDFYNRSGHCHDYSMLLSQLWNNEIVNVVTANIQGLRENTKVTHSFVEILAGNGKQKVMDISLNAIFDKEDYYRLYQVEPLSVVSRDQIHYLINQDYYKEGGYIDKIDLKFLLLYFDDIIKIVESLPETQLNANRNKTENTAPQMGS